MKKPNLTEGDWQVFEPPMNRHVMVLVDDFIVADSLKYEDAEAISAVHDMMDALIMAHEYVLTESSKKGMEGAEDHILINKIEEALEKAGVEI